MGARKLKAEEIIWANRIEAVAFESCFDWEKEAAKDPGERVKAGEDWWGSFDGAGEMCACLVMSHYQVRYDGQVVGLGGVGGVASLPAKRRGGAVRECIRAGLQDLYEHGDVISALYPFSTGYYRQFGYENSVESHLWEVPMKDLPQGDFGGKVRQIFPGEDVSPLLTVYNRFYEGVNLSALREVYDKELLEKDLLREKRNVFLWEDEEGAPGAFCIGGRDGDVLSLRTDFGAHNALLFRDARGLRALLSFLRRAFLPYYKILRFALPHWVPVAPLLPECAGLRRECFFNGMVRAVNVEKMLGLCACKGSGVVTLGVTDPMLEQNNGTYRLCFSEGRANQVERVQAEPDIALGVGTLTALLCGIHTAAELAWLPDVAVSDPSAPFGQVFYHKPCHLAELF